MSPSNVDEIVEQDDAHSTGVEPLVIAQIVVTVAGSRKNCPELMEFSDTRATRRS
jgi:hypothetical protein